MTVKLAALILTLAFFALGWASPPTVRNNADCKQQQRIIGGSSVPDGEYVPYQVSIRVSGTHFCGGSIIAPDRILTAAHCLKGMNMNELSVAAGMLDVHDTSGQSSKVVSCVIHEEFDNMNVSNDIGIVKIHPPFKFDNYKVNSIELMEDDDENLLGRHVTATGWGLVSNVDYPERLQRLTYKVVPNDMCGKHPGLLCAYAGYDKGAGSCDSGGPLVIYEGNGIKQVGVVSYVWANHTDGYMRVAYYREWIKKNLK